MSDEDFMALALAQARMAAISGEVPVGAVVVHQGRVIAVGRNSPVQDRDPTAHAEINALRAAALALGNYRLDECELFVTLEPCAMCSGAMLSARLKRVVFGASEPKTGAGGSVINLFAQTQLNHQTQWQGGVLAEAGRSLMQAFFRQRRADQRETARQQHPLRDDALRTPDAAFDGLAGYPWAPHYLADLPALGGLRMHYLDAQTLSVAHGCEPHQTYLCLHDGTTWSYAFHKLIPSLLQAGHRVIAPDLIGFGKSDKPKKERFHTFNRHRQILLELVERLDLRHIVLVLPQPGALLGLTLPVAAPQRYQGLRTLNTATLVASDDMPLDAGFLMWKKAASKTLDEDFSGLPGCAALCAANQVAFPDKGYRAGVRGFHTMALNPEKDLDASIFLAAEQFFGQWQNL
jgi:tRNA(adenine34) deaminase